MPSEPERGLSGSVWTLSEATRQHLLQVAGKNGAVVWVEDRLDVGERSVAVIAAWGRPRTGLTGKCKL